MIKTGLVSVTFRQLSAKEIVGLVHRAGLHGIEWGGDIHVPHGDLDSAREVYKMTVDAGLVTASYGSYYKTGCGPAVSPSFEQVLETALELHAPGIRVWAGDRGSAKADAAWRNGVSEDTRRIAAMAENEGVRISFEYHQNTLTDTLQSTLDLLLEIGHNNVYTYWQPQDGYSVEKNSADLVKLKPLLTNIHVFHWRDGGRLPLAEGLATWPRYMEVVAGAGGDRYCLLEFVKDDSPEQFMEDAAALKKLLAMS